VVAAHLEHFLIFWEYIHPLETEPKHFSCEFEDLLHISFSCLKHKCDERIEVQIHLSSNELGAFGGVGEAQEAALSGSLDPVQHGHLVCIVHVEVSESHPALACVALRVFSESCDSGGADSYCL